MSTQLSGGPVATGLFKYKDRENSSELEVDIDWVWIPWPFFCGHFLESVQSQGPQVDSRILLG